MPVPLSYYSCRGWRSGQPSRAHLDHSHILTPIAIETTEVFGLETLKFLKELGHRLKQTSGECNAYPYLLSVAVQRGIAASAMGSVEDFFPVTFYMCSYLSGMYVVSYFSLSGPTVVGPM